MFIFSNSKFTHFIISRGTECTKNIIPYRKCYSKVFIMMFKDITDQGELRFAQSPSGGGKGNPAWDFVFLARNYEIGKDIGFTAAAVYKDFKGREDVIRTWEKWSGDQVNRP